MTWGTMPRSPCGNIPQKVPNDWFARALDAARREARLSVKEVARIIGRTPKATERILAGDNAPQIDALLAACAAFRSVFDEFADRCGQASNATEAERVLADIAAKLRERGI